MLRMPTKLLKITSKSKLVALLSAHACSIENEDIKVQLQILTCAVKMYINNKAKYEATISSLL